MKITVIGAGMFISDADNEAFSDYWEYCQEDGTLELLEGIRGSQPGPITNSLVLGILRVDKDPADRSFYYYVAVESNQSVKISELESFKVPSASWAVFTNDNNSKGKLAEIEEYVINDWLPNSGYTHAHAPELELYLDEQKSDTGLGVEFWVPVTRR